jgi:hypothetical protein
MPVRQRVRSSCLCFIAFESSSLQTFVGCISSLLMSSCNQPEVCSTCISLMPVTHFGTDHLFSKFQVLTVFGFFFAFFLGDLLSIICRLISLIPCLLGAGQIGNVPLEAPKAAFQRSLLEHVKDTSPSENHIFGQQSLWELWAPKVNHMTCSFLPFVLLCCSLKRVLIPFIESFFRTRWSLCSCMQTAGGSCSLNLDDQLYRQEFWVSQISGKAVSAQARSPSIGAWTQVR